MSLDCVGWMAVALAFGIMIGSNQARPTPKQQAISAGAAILGAALFLILIAERFVQ